MVILDMHLFLSLPNLFETYLSFIVSLGSQTTGCPKFPILSVSLLLIVVAVSDIRLPIVEVIRGNLLERDEDKRGKGG